MEEKYIPRQSQLPGMFECLGKKPPRMGYSHCCQALEPRGCESARGVRNRGAPVMANQVSLVYLQLIEKSEDVPGQIR